MFAMRATTATEATLSALHQANQRENLGESSEPPRAGPIRDPPEAARAWAEAAGDIDAFALEPNTQHMPDYENQRQDVDW